MNCRYCGAQNDGNAIFCGQCGYQLIDDKTALRGLNDTLDVSASSLPNTKLGSVDPDKKHEQSHNWLTIGDEYSAAERYTEALAAYEQAIRLVPNSAKAYSGKGYALERLKRYSARSNNVRARCSKSVVFPEPGSPRMSSWPAVLS